MLEQTKNLVKFVNAVKPNEEATISLSVRKFIIEGFFYLNKGNGRDVFTKVMLCPTMELVVKGNENEYVVLRGIFDGYNAEITFLKQQ